MSRGAGKENFRERVARCQRRAGAVRARAPLDGVSPSFADSLRSCVGTLPGEQRRPDRPRPQLCEPVVALAAGLAGMEPMSTTRTGSFPHGLLHRRRIVAGLTLLAMLVARAAERTAPRMDRSGDGPSSRAAFARRGHREPVLSSKCLSGPMDETGRHDTTRDLDDRFEDPRDRAGSAGPRASARHRTQKWRALLCSRRFSLCRQSGRPRDW